MPDWWAHRGRSRLSELTQNDCINHDVHAVSRLPAATPTAFENTKDLFQQRYDGGNDRPLRRRC
jgi:hypothetical protein